MIQQLQKLDAPARCGLSGMRPCGQTARWQVLGSAQGPETAVCDACILIMADMNDDNEMFFRPALDEIADRHERRRLFMHTMRQPAMRILRLALWYLKWDRGIEWRDIQEIQVDHYLEDCWMMNTDRFQVVSLNVSPAMTYDDFHFAWVHQQDNPSCPCEFCEAERRVA